MDIFQGKLEKVEQDIADAEYEYLEETDHGNIVKGFDGFLHFRFSSQNRKTRVRCRDRIFSRSSVTCPLPDEEDAPFQTPSSAIEALTAALSGTKLLSSSDIPMNLPDDKTLVAPPIARRRRNTVAGSEGTVTAPLTPVAVKVEEVPQTVGTAKRTSSRRRKT